MDKRRLEKRDGGGGGEHPFSVAFVVMVAQKFTPAMEFAFPRGKPPDDFSADDSYESQLIRRNHMNLAYLWVALGGALGSVSRYWLASLIANRWSALSFPLGILVINVTGSFIIGLCSAFADPNGRMAATPSFRQFFMVGVCGGYTTFSSFSLDTLKLVRAGDFLYAGGNVLLSVTLCLIAVWLGYLLGLALNSMKGN
jgi:fluoride exporter